MNFLISTSDADYRSQHGQVIGAVSADDALRESELMPDEIAVVYVKNLETGATSVFCAEYGLHHIEGN